MKLFIYTVFALLCCQMYAQDYYTIADVQNNIALGPLAGNRDIAFGVKNILEEVIQDEGFDLGPNSSKQIEVSLLYFDVKKTNMQFAVYAKNSDVTEIIAQAKLVVDGKSKKPVIAKGTAKSISTATLIIDQGGKFSQANVSTALKKVCVDLVKKLKL
jgi:uncharacterized lipoprotein YajG